MTKARVNLVRSLPRKGHSWPTGQSLKYILLATATICTSRSRCGFRPWELVQPQTATSQNQSGPHQKDLLVRIPPQLACPHPSHCLLQALVQDFHRTLELWWYAFRPSSPMVSSPWQAWLYLLRFTLCHPSLFLPSLFCLLYHPV